MILLIGGSVWAGNLPSDTESAQPAATPFWKKEKVYKRICSDSDKYIAVSADTDKKADGLFHMKVATAGHIYAPLKFTWSKIIEFENYSKWTDHFQEVRYYPDSKRLFVHGVALGWHAEMTLKMKFFEGEKTRAIDFEVVEGHFRGMTGIIRLEAFNADRTEISMEATYKSENIPLPKILMGVGLEGVGQRVSGIMRQQIEKRYRSP